MSLDQLIKEFKEDRQKGFISSRDFWDCSYKAGMKVAEGVLSIEEGIQYAIELMQPRPASASRLREEIERVANQVKAENESAKKFVEQHDRVEAGANLNLSGRESIAELSDIKQQWMFVKDQLKRDVCDYLVSQGATKKQLKQLVAQVIEVAADGDVESRFNADKHAIVIDFARRYNECQDALFQLEQEIKNAKGFRKSYGCDRDEW